MEERVIRAGAEAGMSDDGIGLLRASHRVAMRARESGPAALADDHHPAFLHPGRTALLLLHDAGERDPVVLAAGVLSETRDLALGAVAGELAVLSGWPGGEQAMALREQLPTGEWRSDPGEEADASLLEALVLAGDAVLRIAVCEALDHLRHAHLWAEGHERARAVALAERVYGPLSSRVHPALSRRYAWWLRRVAPGLRRGGGTG